ncbi:hypothetical protein C8J45_102367 [Sphingomonas sp. PP-CE-3G-477]|uniref:hypothetical protein n=1 Tax=Sphingomonas sp. PP-CE-3G-477 TaxID=2135660 RepID=UPI000D3BB752|nr:hypothetical protein [Sphingomonas sp. PP-CE-3G-477]PTQ65009.1 hypothetical protein C8J45_102367 [Sphingomonas sp. PP-CE-3G-477]
MTNAFHGDPVVKAELLDRLRRHAAAGTLVFGPTRWDGRSGTPIGVSVESEDSADYAQRFGYPLPLAALLDTMTACAAPDRAVRETLAWVEIVEPGANLSPVPWRIAKSLLVLLKADQLADPHFLLLRDMHSRDTTDTPVSRKEWTNLRALIEDTASRSKGEAAFSISACAAACWPLQTSRSVLVELVDRWRRAAARLPNPDFDDVDRDRASTVLNALWAETEPARAAGETIHIPTLFRGREPRVAALFEADLDRSNALFRSRSEAVPALVLRQLAGAGSDETEF